MDNYHYLQTNRREKGKNFRGNKAFRSSRGFITELSDYYNPISPEMSKQRKIEFREHLKWFLLITFDNEVQT